VQLINSFSNDLILVLLVIASWCDLRTRKIPNLLILVGIFSGLSCSLFLDSAVNIQAGLLGFCVGIALFAPLYLLGAIGAGDVKLLGVVGLFVGLQNILAVVAFTALSGGVLGLIYILKTMMSNLKAKKAVTQGFESIQLPYAVAISFGTLLVLTNTPNFF